MRRRELEELPWENFFRRFRRSFKIKNWQNGINFEEKKKLRLSSVRWLSEFVPFAEILEKLKSFCLKYSDFEDCMYVVKEVPDFACIYVTSDYDVLAFCYY